jgi:hypothetical protein
MSPELVNERVRALIAHGLISTERTRSQACHATTLLITGYSTFCRSLIGHSTSCFSVYWPFGILFVLFIGYSTFCRSMYWLFDVLLFGVLAVRSGDHFV